MAPDVINGCFEFGMAFFATRSILRLHRDRIVRGVAWEMIAFAMVWGWWNLFYYPHLDQWFSTVGAVALAVANTTWVLQAIYWTRHEGKRMAYCPGWISCTQPLTPEHTCAQCGASAVLAYEQAGARPKDQPRLLTISAKRIRADDHPHEF